MTPSHPAPNGRRRAGRPRSQAVDSAIVRATGELLRAGGVPAVTINAVARRSGVARGSIYLRFPNRDALVVAAIRAATGRDPIPITGDLETDLHRGADQVRAILSSPRFRSIFPRLVEGLLEPRGEPASITFDMLGPNRPLLVEEYRELAATAGLRTDVDAEMVVNLIIGGLLTHLLVTGRPPTTDDAEHVIDLILDGVRTRPAARPRGRRTGR